MAALKRSALGRGLDALITMDDLKTGGSSSISEIELSKTSLIRSNLDLSLRKRPWRSWLPLSAR